MKKLAATIYQKLPAGVGETIYLRIFSFFKIPLINWVGPRVVELSREKTIIKIPLNRRTKNHFDSLYFGVLCTGADCAGGLAAMEKIKKSGQKVSLAFKSFNAEFLKRAEGDTYFTCLQGEEINKFVEQVLSSNERQHFPVKITATCPDKLGDEPVAEFELLLSLKKK